MEHEYREKITQHLPELIQITQCSPLFLTIFLPKHVFSRSDLESIKTEEQNRGQQSACHKFYDLLQGRKYSWKVLLDALKETRQDGVLDILESSSKSEAQSKQKMFSPRPPTYITEYIQNPGERYLIVISEDCELTCRRILESTQNCELYDDAEILEKIAVINDDLVPDTIFLTNLGNNLDSIYSIEEPTKLKAVFVTNVNEADLQVQLPELKDWWEIVNDDIQWKYLSFTAKRDIISGLRERLEMDGKQLSEALNNVDSKMLINFLRGNFVEPTDLFDSNIPPPLPYYVKRFLQTRYIITKWILKEDLWNDYILFSGIEKPVLSDLCRGKGTDTSSNLIINKRGVSSFIYLETSSHFEKICERFPGKSIHLLNFEDGEFVWKRTRGSIYNVQKFVASEQKQLKETDLISGILSQSNLSPVCISDTPGKGKSVLLAAIAAELKSHHKNGIVGFIRIKELIQQFKENGAVTPTVSTAVSVISSFLSSSPLGQKYLLTHRTYLREILLDGFDEIDADDTDFGYDCLKATRSALKDTRVWITSRPHMLPYLERLLETLGYNITPFSDQDQVNFLSSYWEISITDCQKENLSNFAGECLQNIKRSLGKTDEDIAGIPLQCFLIAEAFQEDAKLFIEGSSSKDLFTPPLITTITDLYEKLIEKKLADFRHRYNSNNIDRSEIFVAHMRLAIEFLYPKNLHNFSGNLVHQMSMQEILDFGLVEAKNVLSPFRFLHTTFAEYFVALFVSEFLGKNSFLLDFLLNDIMKTRGFQITLKTCDHNEYDIQGFEFTNYVICYFLNSFVEEKELIFPHGYISLTRLRSIAEASVHHNYENILRKLLSLNELKSHIINEGFLCSAVYWGNVSLLEVVIREYVIRIDATHQSKIDFDVLDELRNYQKNKGDSDDFESSSTSGSIYIFEYTLLHLAMKKGEFATVEFLMENGFRELVDKNEKGRYNRLVHELLYDSGRGNEWSTIERKHIINYLARVNMDLLVMENTYNLPLEVDNIHTDLIKEILIMAKQLYMKRNVLNRLFIHFTDSPYNVSCSNFLIAVFTSLNQRAINSVFSTTFSCCLLKQVSGSCEVTTEFLEFLKKNCSKFCCVDITCKIEAIINAAKHAQPDSVMEWLSSYLIHTKEDLKVILPKCCNAGWPGIFNVLLNYLTKKNTTNEILFVVEAFKLVFSDTDPTNCENIRTFLHLIAFCVGTVQSKMEIKTDLETTDIYSVDLGLTYCQELQNKNLINCFQSCIIKICWISCFRLYLTRQNFESRLKTCLEDAVIPTNDSLGNSVLHVFASYLEMQYCFRLRCEIDFLNHIAQLVDFYQVWKTLIKNSFNILQCNDHHLTPIGLLPKEISYHGSTLSAILFAANHMAAQTNWNISDAHKIFYLVIKHHSITVVKEVCIWYSGICNSQNVEIPQVVVSFGDETSNYLDAAIDNGCGDVVEFVNTDLKIFCPMLAPSPLCIHKSIRKYPTFNSSISFIKNVAKMFPSEVRRLVNTSNEQNLVPLSLPDIESEHVSLLHELGADVNARDNDGNTPLHFALKHIGSDLRVVKELIKFGANVNAQNSCQETPLSFLFLNEEFRFEIFECFEILINNGADLVIKDKMGNTPVHRLFENILSGHILHRYVMTIIESKIEYVLTLKNNEGRTPLDLADINCFIPKHTKELLKNYNIII